MRSDIGIFVAMVLTAALSACSNGSHATAGSSVNTTKSTKVMASSNGAAVYETNCSTCHQSDGKGAIGPPLAGNALVTGDPQKVIHIVKNGLTGSVQVSGKNFNGTMPAWKGTLSNADIAGVITFIRSAWGNKAGGVTSAQVASTP